MNCRPAVFRRKSSGLMTVRADVLSPVRVAEKADLRYINIDEQEKKSGGNEAPPPV